jgi:hypothetical protein
MGWDALHTIADSLIKTQEVYTTAATKVQKDLILQLLFDSKIHATLCGSPTVYDKSCERVTDCHGRAGLCLILLDLASKFAGMPGLYILWLP